VVCSRQNKNKNQRHKKYKGHKKHNKKNRIKPHFPQHWVVNSLNNRLLNNQSNLRWHLDLHNLVSSSTNRKKNNSKKNKINKKQFRIFKNQKLTNHFKEVKMFLMLHNKKFKIRQRPLKMRPIYQ